MLVKYSGLKLNQIIHFGMKGMSQVFQVLEKKSKNSLKLGI